MGYLLKSAASYPVEWKAIQEEARKKEQEEKEEAARELIGIPSTGVALGGAGLGLLGSAALQGTVDKYTGQLFQNELDGNFNKENATLIENILKNDNVAFLDSLALAPSSINSAHPVMLEAFEKLPKDEQTRILLRGGHWSPFALSDQDIIWRGVSDKASAGVLAHEYGHILNARERKGKWTENLHGGLYRMGHYAPGAAAAALAAAGLFGASDKALLYGGLLGSATSLPQIWEEIKASHKGAKFLKENNLHSESKDAWSGVPSYAINAILPLLPYLARKTSKAIFSKKKKKKDKK